MKTPHITLLLAAFITSQVALSQATLVKDINTTPRQFRESNDYSSLFCNCGGKLFFAGSSGEFGNELWVSDGTTEGTRMVKDINTGYQNGINNGGFLQCHSSGKVIFIASDPGYDTDVWSSDGTAEGTQILTETATGLDGFVSLLKAVNDHIYYSSYNYQSEIIEIWEADGSANTSKISSFDLPKPPTLLSLNATNTHLYWMIFNDNVLEVELWVTNILTGTTSKLTTIKSYDFSGHILGNKFLFASDPEVDYSFTLYITDGTVEGTQPLAPLSYPFSNFTVYNDKLLFSSGNSTWITDGTSANTYELTSGYLTASVIAGGNFYGFGYDFNTGNRIFKTDGTEVTSTLLPGDAGDIKMSGKIPVLNDKMLFQFYSTEAGQELGITDATFSTISLVKDINPGEESSLPRSWEIYNDKGYFLADDGKNGVSLWTTDGTEAGTSLVKDLSNGTNDAFAGDRNALYVSDGKLHVLAATRGSVYGDNDLYTTEGTEETTVMKKEFVHQSGTNIFGKAGENLIIFNQWKFFAVRGNTSEMPVIGDVQDVTNGSGYAPRQYFSVGDKLLFHWSITGVNPVNLGGEFWVSDATAEGTHVLKDISPGAAAGAYENGVVVGEKLFFNGIDPVNGSELWVSDGTEGGTVLVKDINPGPNNATLFSYFLNFAALGKGIVFLANTPETGRELWISDGTKEGTSLIVDLAPGADSLDASNFTTLPKAVIFARYIKNEGWSLWKTNGTASGTVQVVDLPDNISQIGPSNFLGIGNTVFFAYDDGIHGNELWVSDGTEVGTHVIDIAEGEAGSSPSNFYNIHGIAYFNCLSQLWRSNGTIIGTEQVNDYGAVEIEANGDWVYFVSVHPQYGMELFKVPFTKRDQQITLSEVADKTLGDESVIVQTAATSGLPVVITAEEEITVKGDTLSFVKAGSVTIKATQLGDSLFNAVSISESICIRPVRPQVTMPTDMEVSFWSSADAGNQWFKDDTAIKDATASIFAPSESGAYKVQVTVDGCSSEFSAVETIVITGIESLEKQISLYPNPAKENVRITSADTSPVDVTIFDIQGRPVGSFKLNHNEYVDHNLMGYPQGLYMVRITTEKGVSYEKLMKE